MRNSADLSSPDVITSRDFNPTARRTSRQRRTADVDSIRPSEKELLKRKQVVSVESMDRDFLFDDLIRSKYDLSGAIALPWARVE